jgi:hypothetical protein
LETTDNATRGPILEGDGDHGRQDSLRPLLGGDVAVVEARLVDDDGDDLAIATATARVIPIAEARTAL